jgi:AcrR family transcriptional regulator
MGSDQRRKRPRKPGRPRADGTDQRERLLDVALASFAANGIAATSLRALAHDCGVTPAMLNYYFGTRERLVAAVVDERLLPVIREQQQSLAALLDAGGPTLAQAFVTGLDASIRRNPWLPSLWVREVLSDGGQLRPIFLERIGPILPRPLVERFRASQAAGEINPALDPRLLFVSLIGLTMLPYAAAPIWRQVFDADDIGPPQILEHTLALLSGGLEG